MNEVLRVKFERPEPQPDDKEIARKPNKVHKSKFKSNASVLKSVRKYQWVFPEEISEPGPVVNASNQ